MEKTYSTGDVIGKVPGLTRRKITYWIKKNHLDEVQTLWSGDNFQYRFTEADVKTLKKIQGNIEKGWTLKAAAEKARTYCGNRKRRFDSWEGESNNQSDNKNISAAGASVIGVDK